MTVNIHLVVADQMVGLQSSYVYSGTRRLQNCSNEGDMNDENNRYKTITCLFKFNASVVCSPTGKVNLFYSSLFLKSFWSD